MEPPHGKSFTLLHASFSSRALHAQTVFAADPVGFFPGCVVALTDSTLLLLKGMAALERGPFLVLFLHAYGGLLVSLVVKYTDTIVKAFAASLSIVLGTLVSWLLFSDFVLSNGFLLGALLVTGSVYKYSVI